MSEITKPPTKPSKSKGTEPVEVDALPNGPQGVLQASDPSHKKKWEISRILLSFLLVFVLPSLVSTWYYLAVASDRYASGASFVVRGLTAGGSPDLFSSFTGMASAGSTTSDSYVIRRFLQSPDLVMELETNLGLRKHYSDVSVDWLSRFDDAETFEKFVEYWQQRITTTYDNSTQIVTFEAQAFTPVVARQLADAILDRTSELVNELSEKARQDSVQFAASEVERSEERLRVVQLAIREFRSSRGSVDPALNSQLDAQLIASLESQLVEVSARIATFGNEASVDAPVLRQLLLQQRALTDQINQRREAVGGNNTAGISTADALAEFEALQIEQTFAQQRYASALSSLENARMDADRQQRYLAVFSHPITAEEAIYPERLRNVFLCLAAFMALWVIGTLVTLAVRDHLR